MEVDVAFLSRRGTAIMRRSQRATGTRVRIGRGSDNEVPLNDIHVGLHAASLIVYDGVLTIDRLDNTALEVNGDAIETAPLKPGDEIRLGPYRIEILAPPEGCDGAIQIELVAAAAGAPERLGTGVRIGLAQTGWNKRVLAWTGFLVVAVICLAVPIVVFSGGFSGSWHKDTSGAALPTAVGLSWNAGSFSNAHRFFAADCATCHQGAFASVADGACLTCHANVGSHTQHGAMLASVGAQLKSMRCVDCHSEHRGIEGSVVREARFCLDCHRNLNETAPAAAMADIGGFPKGHPQFRATLVADAAQAKTVRVALGGTPPAIDRPGLKFEHKAHMDTMNYPALGDRRVKGCADCHVAEPSGQGFQPITYKNQCQRCHELTFDQVALPWQGATVPHGDDTGVIATVWNFYAGLALQDGKAATPSTPAMSPVERRAAGSPAPPAPSPPPIDTQAWVNAKTMTALRVVFDDKRGCAYCHYSTSANGAWDVDKILGEALPPKANPPHVVAPVILRTRFLPNAVFDHASHRGMTCENCHTVATAVSSGTERLMVPGIENCTQCHGAENASLRAQSTCITCHVFHHSEFGLMRTTAAGAMQ
jgi:Cytochrome c3/Cytochrome c7 and related cytochrome c